MSEVAAKGRLRGVLLRDVTLGWGKDVLSTLLPGGHAVVFGGFRVALEAEDAGFEVRDSITVLGPNRDQAWLFRKPIESGNVASQVLATGTGAIWIEGCRVSTSDSLNGGAYAGGLREKTTEWQNADRSGGKGSGFRQGLGDFQTPSGRWPPNLLLIHGSGCRREGTLKIPGHKGYPNGPGGKSHHYQSEKRSADVRPNAWVPRATAEDGTETVANWVCEPGCPVAELDRQSGKLKSGGGDKGGHVGFKGQSLGGGARMTEPDTGGASRFFPQFGSDDELDAWLLRLILGPV